MSSTYTYTEAIFTVTTPEGRFEVKAKDTRTLDDAIKRGLILDARVWRSGANEWPWRLNMAKVTAYLAEPVAVRD
jgi:hypothetical protein